MRPIAVAAALVMGLAVSQGSVQAQTGGTIELAGEWTGYGIDGGGNRIDLVLRFARGDEGYAGVLQGAGETTPEMPLRNITVVGSTVTFDFDFVGGRAPELIRVRLEYRGGTLTGSYIDSVGDSDRMYFERGSEPERGE